MLANVGHTIQKMIGNTPVAVSVNATTSTVVTGGGSVFQAGLIGNKIQDSFQEVLSNQDIVGNVVDAQSTDSSVYFLNSAGSVFKYDYNQGNPSCNPRVREVYSPCVCNGDPAIKIVTGRDHAVILTAAKKVFGVGCNREYQIVPQGQCSYDVAVEIIITDTNKHDNKCCCGFTGIYHELTTPVLPSPAPCNNVSCVSGSPTAVRVGTLDVGLTGLTYNNGLSYGAGTLQIPIYADYTYSGVLCAGPNNTASGSVTVNVTGVYIRAGAYLGAYTPSGQVELMVTDTLNLLTVGPVVPQTLPINGDCGSEVSVIPSASLITLVAIQDNNGNLLLTGGLVVPTIAVVNAALTVASVTPVMVYSGLPVVINCCPKKTDCCTSKCAIPQPCWMDVFAGWDISVLVDACNQLYVLGSLHKVRNNHDLLKRGCLDKLLNGTSATITLPADQLNCCVKPRNDDCKCVECQRSCKTDLSKFGIQLNFPTESHYGRSNGYDCSSCSNNTSLCDFLQNLQKCNDAPLCSNTCEPCDSYIYLDVYAKGDSVCGYGGVGISSITLYNKKSVCKAVSTGQVDQVIVELNCHSVVEFDLNKYCVDGADYCLDKTIVLNFGQEGYEVNLYIDLDTPGGLKFELNCGGKNNVEFKVDQDTDTHKWLLNYGSVLDPVELANLRGALLLASTFPCPCYLNPFTNKVTNTYLKGGDAVSFLGTCEPRDTRAPGNCSEHRQAITADLPTVFRLSRRVLDVGVGDNNLSVLVGGLACPNEIFVIGENCHGELGLGSYESQVCWKQVNRCLFDCQVNGIFSGCGVTFYVTQSRNVYASGSWKCLVHSSSPVCVPSICQAWKTKDIAVGKSHIVILGSDGCVFGLGDNSLGQLGMCHCECVKKPKPISFFYRLNQCAAKQLCGGLAHPVERNCKKKPDCGCEDKLSCHCHEEVRYIRCTQTVKTKAYIPNNRCGPRKC